MNKMTKVITLSIEWRYSSKMCVKRKDTVLICLIVIIVAIIIIMRAIKANKNKPLIAKNCLFSLKSDIILSEVMIWENWFLSLISSQPNP